MEKPSEIVYVIHVTRKNCSTSVNVFKELRPAVNYLNWTLDACKVFTDKAKQKTEMRRILEMKGNSWSYGHILNSDTLQYPHSVVEWVIETQPIL